MKKQMKFVIPILCAAMVAGTGIGVSYAQEKMQAPVTIGTTVAVPVPTTQLAEETQTEAPAEAVADRTEPTTQAEVSALVAAPSTTAPSAATQPATARATEQPVTATTAALQHGADVPQLNPYERQVFEQTNRQRLAAGLTPYQLNAGLCALAQKKAQDMYENGYCGHNSPVLGTPFEMMANAGFTYRVASENIAGGYETPEDVVDGWMQSPGHRAAILHERQTEIGVAYYLAPNGYTYWVQLFLLPA